MDDRSIEVRNRDIPLLADTLSIMQAVCLLEERRVWQRDRLFNITQHLTGMPGGNYPKGLDEAFSAMSELDDEHKQRCKEYVRKLKKIENILNSIESQSMRDFVELKYVMNVPDTEIRNGLNMTRRGFDRARISIESAPCMADVKWQERYILVQED